MASCASRHHYGCPPRGGDPDEWMAGPLHDRGGHAYGQNHIIQTVHERMGGRRGRPATAPSAAHMTPSSHPRRSKRTAVRIFVLLFVAIVVGFHLTVGPDVVDLSGVWSLVVILAVLVLIVALFVVK